MKSILAPLLLVVAATTGGVSGSNPAHSLQVTAVLRDQTALAGAHDVEVREGMAFVAGKGGALALVDVRDPSSPSLRWAVRERRLYEDAQTVLPLESGRWLVGTRDIHLFDAAGPNHLRLVASLRDRNTVDRINGFARIGNLVCGANKLGWIVAIDVSQPTAPRLLGARHVQRLDDLSSPHAVAFASDLLVVVDGGSFGRGGEPGRLAVYQVLDPHTRVPLSPDQWTLLGTLTDIRLAGANRVMARSPYAYVGSSLAPDAPRKGQLCNNVSVVDLREPHAPKLRGHLRFPDERGPNGLELAGRLAFAAGGRTIQAVDLTDPDNPHELARFTDVGVFPGGADDAHDLVYANGNLYVTAQTSHALAVLRVGDALRVQADQR